MLEKILRSNAEVRVLGVVLSSDGLHLREISRRAGISPFEAKRELEILESAGLLRREKKGNLSVFFLRKECPFFSELRGLYFKTEGVVAEFGKAVGKLAGVKWAFVYGSFAEGNFSETSDVDVMLLGSVDEADANKACFTIQKKTGWAIHPVVWTEKDLLQKARGKSAFLASLLKKKKIWIAGEENEFERFAEKAR